jgi:pilus assembly protein CpaB
MSAVRLFILVIAAVAAIALAFVVRGAFSSKKAPRPVAAAEAPVATGTASVRVLVAKRDLPTGTTLAAGDMGWQDWPAEGLNSTFTTDGAPASVKQTGAKGAAKDAAAAAGGLFGDSAIKSFEGAVVREPFVTGEPIVVRKIVKAGEGNYMSVVLKPGHRAMSVPVTVDTAAGGFILPGDRVDIILSRDGGGDKGMVTETVLRNVRVLAIDQTIQAEKDAKTMLGAVATLEIASGDSELVAQAQARAKAGGTLALALRSYTDAGAPTTRGSGGGGRTVRVFKAGTPTEVTITR